MADSNRYIFLADDDEDYHHAFLDTLKDFENHYLETSLNGKDALIKLMSTANTPDLIFLDINMPELNGFECLALIKKNERLKKVPVIVYSSSEHKCFMETSQNLCAIGYIVKPEYSTNLKERLQTALLKHFQQTNTGFDTPATFFVIK